MRRSIHARGGLCERSVAWRNTLIGPGAGRSDPAADGIAKVVNGAKFDLLLMGSHRRGSWGNVGHGIGPTKELASTKVAVLLVR